MASWDTACSFMTRLLFTSSNKVFSEHRVPIPGTDGFTENTSRPSVCDNDELRKFASKYLEAGWPQSERSEENNTATPETK